MAADKHKIWLISSIVIVILIIGFIFLYPNLKKGLAGQAIGTPVSLTLALGEIGIDPVSGTIKTGDTFQVAIKANLGSKSANSVETTLLYDKSKLEVTGVNSYLKTNSQWPEGVSLTINKDTLGIVSYKNEIGTSTIAKKITGKVNIFRVNFKVKADAKTGASVIFLKNTLILDGTINLITKNKASTLTIESAAVCTPSCSGKTCGDDGCGGSCGSCGAGTTCSSGSCLTSCTSNSDCPITCDGTKGSRKNCEYGVCAGLTETWLAEECAEKVECTINTDCAAGEKCENNVCVATPVLEICDNKISDDTDTLIDCFDYKDCEGQSCGSGCLCVKTTIVGKSSGSKKETDCTDKIDNDNDFKNDCKDPDCGSNPVCAADYCTADTDCAAGQKCENSACVAQEAGTCSKGDLNADKSITSDDVTAMLYVLDAQSKTTCGDLGQTVCDYSGDGYFICKNGIIFAMNDENDLAHQTDQCGEDSCAPVGDLNGDKSITSDDVTAMLYVLDAQSKTTCGGSGQTVCDYSSDGYFVCKNGVIYGMADENDLSHAQDKC